MLAKFAQAASGQTLPPIPPAAPPAQQADTTRTQRQSQFRPALAAQLVATAQPQQQLPPQPAKSAALAPTVKLPLRRAPPASVESTTRTTSNPPALTAVQECFWTQQGHFLSTIVRAVPRARTRAALAHPLAQTAHLVTTRAGLELSSAPIARPGKPSRPPDKQCAPTARLGATS